MWTRLLQFVPTQKRKITPNLYETTYGNLIRIQICLFVSFCSMDYEEKRNGTVGHALMSPRRRANKNGIQHRGKEIDNCSHKVGWREGLRHKLENQLTASFFVCVCLRMCFKVAVEERDGRFFMHFFFWTLYSDGISMGSGILMFSVECVIPSITLNEHFWRHPVVVYHQFL